jgi:hypothetical protein
MVFNDGQAFKNEKGDIRAQNVMDPSLPIGCLTEEEKIVSHLQPSASDPLGSPRVH